MNVNGIIGIGYAEGNFFMEARGPACYVQAAVMCPATHAIMTRLPVCTHLNSVSFRCLESSLCQPHHTGALYSSSAQ